MSNVVTYVCKCGNLMAVSVDGIDQNKHETRTCDRCGAEAPWDEFTVGE